MLPVSLSQCILHFSCRAAQFNRNRKCEQAQRALKLLIFLSLLTFQPSNLRRRHWFRPICNKPCAQ